MKFLSKKPYFIAVLGGVLVVFLIVAGAYYWYKARHFETVVIKKTDIRADIKARGKVIAAESIDLGFETDGKISGIFVKQGDNVSFGDKLAQLDTTKSLAELKQYQAEIETDKLKLARFLSGARVEEAVLAESKAEQAKIVLENARQELEDLKLKTENDLSGQYALALDYADAALLVADNAVKALDGIYASNNKFFDIFVIPDSQKKSEAEWQAMFARSALGNIKSVQESLKKDSSRKNTDQALAQFKINLALIRSSLQKTADIFETAAMVFGAPDIGTFKTTVAVQRSVVNSTQTTILIMEQDIASVKINSQLEINRVERNIESLELALKTAEDELILKKAAPREIELGVYQAQIKENESRVEVLKNKLENSVIKAPADGITGSVSGRIGSFAKVGEPVLSLVSFSDVEIEAKLSYDDAERVRAGDAVSLSMDGGSYDGKVIGLNGDAARIYFQGDAAQASIGAVADIKIHSVIKSDVILVPKESVFEEDGVKKVNLLENNARKPIAVIVGIERNGQIEIEEGISDGDIIVF